MGALSLLLPYPSWLLLNLCNWHCSGLALPGVPPPKQNWLPHSDQSPCDAACVPSTPSPRVPPTTARVLSITSTSGGPSRYPCSMCSLEVGKDSLKFSTCSKWVHFSCSSLTRADFLQICSAGSPMGWNCPACLNRDLASLTHQQASPAPSLQLRPHKHAQISWIHLYLSPHILPSLTPTFLPPSPYLSHHHHPQAHNQSTTRRPTLKEIHATLTISEFCNGMPAVFPPSVVLN